MHRPATKPSKHLRNMVQRVAQPVLQQNDGVVPELSEADNAVYWP